MPAVAKQPQDHRKPRKATPQRAEAQVDLRAVLTFEWDDEEWNVVPADATSLEFLAALGDEQIITALRLLLGPGQAARLIKGRKVEDLEGFFAAMGEVVDAGNP
jgi:hypothetical protein